MAPGGSHYKALITGALFILRDDLVVYGCFRYISGLTIVLPCFTKMHTIRPILWLHKPNKQGLFPLMIAVTIERKITYFKTSFRLKKNQWGGEIVNYTNSKVANAAIRKQISDIENEILQRQLSGQVITAKTLKKPKSKTFRSFALEVKGDTVHNRKELKRLNNYAPGITLDEVTVTFLRKYEQKERARGMSQNTINTTFKWFRRIINQARKEKLIQYNPFEDFPVPKYEQTDRTYLNEEEKEKLFKKLDPAYPFYNTLCYFLLSCYTGLRHQDWERFSADRIDGDHFKLRAKKNKQLVVMPIGPTLRKIINRVLKLSPPATMQQCNRELKIIGSDAKIKKTLTCHVGRHSYAYMCARNRLPKSITAELMGISERVVEVYYHLEGTDITEQAAVLKTI